MTTTLSELVMAFETGKLSKESIYELFDKLMKSGELWMLPTDYLDKAAMLLQSNLIGDTAAKERRRGMHS